MAKHICECGNEHEIGEEIIDIGQTVLCDICNADYTESDERGGILFGSKAVCPKCEPKMLQSIEFYGEQMHLNGRCPDDTSFRDWVLQLRGGDNTIRIISTK
jgi:ssDNA-binding Zn-finger/Zn-ribbon topoisomerase 1